MARYKLWFANADCPEAGELVEIKASSTEEAWQKGASMPPPDPLLAFEDVFVLDQAFPHLAGTTREEWRSTRVSGAGLTTVRGLV
jgi:hypothetical protein